MSEKNVSVGVSVTPSQKEAMRAAAWLGGRSGSVSALLRDLFTDWLDKDCPAVKGRGDHRE